MLNSLAWWEFDLYVGLIGAIFILYFGLLRWPKDSDGRPVYPEMLLPVGVLFVLSIGQVYQVIQAIPIPLLNGERVSSRMIMIPFVVILLLASISFQRWVEQHARGTAPRWALALLLLPLLNDLWQHLKAWRVNVAYSAYPVAKVDLAIKVVANHADAPYTGVLTAGAAITILTAIFLLAMAWRENRTNSRKPVNP